MAKPTAKPKDAQIEECLRKVVGEAKANNDSDFSIKRARSRVEGELKLDDGFLKNDAEWKSRSKAIIQAAFDEEEAPQPTKQATPSQEARETTKSTNTQVNGVSKEKSRSKPQQSSKSKSVAQTEASTNKATSVPSKPVKTTVDETSKKQAHGQPKPQPRNSSQHSGHGAVQPPESATKATKAPAKATESTASDESSNEGSDDESDGGSSQGKQSIVNNAQSEVAKQPAPKKPEGTPPKVNGVKRKAGEQTSSRESSGESSADEESKDGSEARRVQKKAKTESTTDSEEASEDSHDQSKVATSTKDQSGDQTTAQPTIQAIPPKTFQPPTGYTALTLDQSTESATFSNAHLAGKQIWHITAPSAIPLSSITEVALDAVQSGQPVLTHKGIEYALAEDHSQSRDIDVLLPTKEGYQQAPQKVARTLQLQQKITLPNLSVRQASQVTGSNTAGNIGAAAVSRVRPQPKGLRMRYRPPGFGTGKPGRIGSGSESTDEDEGRPVPGPAFHFPKALGQHGTSTQQSRDVDMKDAETSPQKSAKKSAKKLKEEHGSRGPEPTVNGVGKSSSGSPAAPERTRQSYSPDTSTAKKAAMPAKKTAATPSSALPNGTAPVVESKEDKAKRKEEKRVKKEAKRKAKEAVV